MDTNIKEIVKFIEDSQFFQKYGYKHHRQVSTTIVYPIQTWVDVREIEIQLDPHSCKQWHHRMFKKLVAQIKEKFGDVVEWYSMVRNDGSCPDEARMKIK